MRSDWPPELVAGLSDEEVTRCYMIEMNNGITPIVRLTDFDADQTVGGNTFVHSPGFTVTKFSMANGGRPAGLDFTLPFDGDGPLYSNDIKRGAWRGAAITVWVALFTDPSIRGVLTTGFVGKSDYTDRLAGSLEIITKADALADIILPTVQPKCWYQFGTAPCPVDLSTKTLTATVAVVTSNSKFTITVTNPDALDFTHGKVVFTSGANSGAKGLVRRWTSGTALVEMVSGFPFDIMAGDTLTISAGCKQDRAACKAYGAINSFPGQDFTPGDLLGGN